MLAALKGDHQKFLDFREKSMAVNQGTLSPVDYVRAFFNTFERKDALLLFPGEHHPATFYSPPRPFD